MTNNTTYADTCADMRRLAYVYKYDTRGNVASKRLPGCDPIYQVYDKGNRLVLTQDGNQRQRGHYWTVTKYDAINHPIYSFEVLAGECSTLAAAQQVCEPLNFVEEYSATNNLDNPLSTTGYSRNLFHVHPMNILVVYYYDDYSFLNLPHTPYGPSLTAQSITGYDAVTNGSVKGLLTGQRVYNLKDQSYTTTAFYYDKRGRLVQERSYNLLSGYDCTYYALSFTGKPLKVLTQQTFSGITTSEEYQYRYDSQERLLATRYKLNEDTPMQLDSFVYDDLGRVSRKYMLDKIDSVSYTYNIRSQITKLKSSGFEENVYYTTVPPIAPSAANLCYNGNASVSTWTYGNKTNGTMYYYDDSNRLSYTYGIYNGEWVDMYYSENFSYDKQGNILSVYRMANEDELDMLNLTYEGNQLIKVSDYADEVLSYTSKHYQDGENAQKEMFYDKNGALVADLDRKICTIRNNLLTLPDTIQFSNGNQIVHIYDAMGNRLRTTYYTRKVALVEPVCTTIPGTDNLQEYNIVSYTMLGNKRYIKLNDSPWFLDKVMNDEGYTRFELGDEDYPFYYIKDHLGNIRETYVRTSSNKFCAQRMQYYPSGLPWDESQGASYQPFKYNSKEFVEMHGLDEYDSQARWYYPAIMRTTSMDPLCEKYYSTSPYAWCANNPVNYVDPDGRDFVYNKNKRTYEWRDDITRESSIPDGYEYVGGKPDDILTYMGYASTYETQKTSGLYLGFTGGNETLELPLAKGITSGNRIDAEFTLSLRANIELIEENISEYNRAGITFTGISVEANGVLGMDMMNNVYGESIFGVMTLYGMDDNEKATMLRFPQGESLYSTGVLPLSSNIFLPASTLQKGIWPLTTRLEFGYINSSNLLNCSIPKIEWKLLKRTWIR